MLVYLIFHPFLNLTFKDQIFIKSSKEYVPQTLKTELGKTTYTHMLNEDAGIETDLTVVCIGKDNFRVVGPAGTREHDKYHILKHLSKDIELIDVTEEICCLGLFGPKSRHMISKMSKDEFSSDKFPFGFGKILKLVELMYGHKDYLTSEKLVLNYMFQVIKQKNCI